MNTHTQVKLTEPQQNSIKRLEEMLHILEIHFEVGFGNAADRPIMIKCKSKFNGYELWYGIEPDGYTHS